MSDLRSDLIFESPLVRVFDVTCHAPKSGCSSEECCSVAQVVVPRRGVFIMHQRGTPIVADSNTALIFGVGDTYQVSHPVDGGDQCTVLVFRSELVEEALGSVEARHGTLDAATQLSVHVLTYTVTTGMTDQLEAEESAVLVLNTLSENFRSSLSSSGQRVSEYKQRRADQVRSLLAGQPTEDWHLDSIARAVHCSPFHLARQFRTVTGESVARYLLRLRLALALDRLAQGETDLARLAVELGFVHHSHFSARFRSVFGATPTEVRNILTHRSFQQMSKIVTAKPRTRC